MIYEWAYGTIDENDFQALVYTFRPIFRDLSSNSGVWMKPQGVLFCFVCLLLLLKLALPGHKQSLLVCLLDP